MPKEATAMHHGLSDGSQNLPATDEPAPNAIQCEIVECFERRLGELKQHVGGDIEQCGRALEKQELTPVNLDIDGAAEDAVHSFAMLRSSTRDALLDLRTKEQDMLRELRHFRAENRLFRSAVYIKSRILTVGVLLVLLTAESIVNAKLFALADPMGWVGGWSTAIVTSLVNILPSFLAGVLILRNLHHVHHWRRTFATVALVAFGGALLAYNLLVAHFRIALGTDPENAFASAVPSFVAEPFNIAGSFDAVSLLLIGIFAGVMAAIDGYCLFDDCYPGYGRITRAYDERRESYEKAKRNFRRQIERVVAAQHREIDRRLQTLQKKADGAARALTKALTCISSSQEKADHAAFRCERLLRTYREENKRVRTTPVPSYFATYPALDTSLGVNLAGFQEKKRGMREALTGKMQEAALAKARVRELAQRELVGLSALVDEVEATTERNRDHAPVGAFFEVATIR